ncbi:putative lipoate-protein ligase A [Gemmata sp. SH-PL17]|uniref:lipoate--protein ligase family protein n=1 Tax=Gemmata sp. SH-PL17 TaxID=1630693 RepID=UPI00078BF00B|nr:biotin/lipoate A/B protein ligase family protein [Gemmata sp. SH-PL17]AMV22881.1 putative lipoate-protein ligase A [Gemmata sp. SH-PL17]
MQLLDLTLPDPEMNLALDEALLVAAEEGAGGEVLRLWEQPTYAVVVGSGGSVVIDVNLSACAAAGVPVLRRASGGGTVLLGPGCLCFSLVLSYDRAPGLNEIPASNRYILARVINALKPVAAASVEGTSDLAVNGVKFSGNAQQRKRKYFLHHGTLLCGFDLALVSQYLNPPERQPKYRRDRPHGDFITNLPVRPEEVKQLLVNEWCPEGDYAPVPLIRAHALVAEKYSRAEWNRRR